MEQGVPSFGPGSVVSGRYRVEAKLGEGGYGAVYVATQLNIERRVALKVLHPEVLARKTALERFEREAKLAQGLSHPNVVRLLDYGRTDDGAPFIVFELLDGRSIERELAICGGMPAPRVAHVAQQTLKGLMEAHAQGIVHRDIKPGNIFLCDYAGEPDFAKILDFGIAAAPRDENRSGQLTQEGVSLGTPAYMSPEQVLDLPIDARADLYALGLVMSEMLTGEPVYRGTSAMQVAMRQADAAPVPLPSAVLGSPLGDVIARATQKDPERRFRSALEMLQALRASMALAASSPSGGQPYADAFTTSPTVGVATPLSGSPIVVTPAAIVVSPPPGPARHPSAPPTLDSPGVRPAASGPPPGRGASSSLSAQLVSPRASVVISAPVSPPKRGVFAMVAIVAVAFACGALGFGVYLYRDALLASSKTPKTKGAAKTATAAETESDSEDEFEKAFEDPFKLVPQYNFTVVACRPLNAEISAVRIRGLDVDTMLRRLESAGYRCRSRTDNDFGTYQTHVFMMEKPSVGSSMMVVAPAHMNVFGESSGGALVTDPNGSSVAFTDKDGKRAAESIFGKL